MMDRSGFNDPDASPEEASMRLYLMRHGEALSDAEDTGRPLTDDGRSAAAAVGDFLRSHHVRPVRVCHSPLARAEQTARLVADRMGIPEAPRVLEILGPTEDPRLAACLIADWDEDALLVGHLPHLEALTSLLLTGDPEARSFAMPPATLFCLERSGPRGWKLLAAVHPQGLARSG